MHKSKDDSEIDKTCCGEVRGSLQLQIRCQFVCESKLRRSHAASDAAPNLSWRRCLERSYAKVYSWKQPLSMDDVTWVPVGQDHREGNARPSKANIEEVLCSLFCLPRIR
jgi:hypothetical protein